MLHRYVARGLDTVEKAIPIYAPSWDGNVPARYIWAIKQLISTWQRRDPAPTGVGAGE
ncbi:MAG: hypothetical protein KatS3mg057_0135 [Herpetosiphonaceae bacterium]|nr:MAG: hypothetical protein KatS3mg057_0135 [Herpetosiphonaceae bacterium]